MAGVDFLAEGGFCLVVCCWVVVMFGGLVSLEKVMFFVVGLFVVVVVCWFVVVGVGCCCFRIGVGLIVYCLFEPTKIRIHCVTCNN